MSELVHLQPVDGVATITLDSEHNRNALSTQLVRELGEHLATADADPRVRAIVLRSAGKVFCSGADLSEAGAGSLADGTKAVVALLRQIATAGTPVVVVLEGPVRAGGLGIVGAADIVVATEAVTFQLTEVRLGLAPYVIALTLLPRLTDRAAADTFLTGRRFSAADAASYGLITRVVRESELEADLQATVADILKGYPQGLRETKKLLNHALVKRIDELGDEFAESSATLFASAEAGAAMKSFRSRKQST